MLGAKGLLVLVMPIAKIIGNRNFVQYLDSFYEDIQFYAFPDGHRPYSEIVIFGRKRKIEIPIDAVSEHGVLHQRGWQWNTYMRAEDQPPARRSAARVVAWQPAELRPCTGNPDLGRREGWKPGTFKKTQFTDEELHQVVEDSPLAKHLTEVQPREIPRPPLPLDKGHLGLILASGILDGVVESPHGPHVVRGSSTKVEYHNKEASDSTEDPETGAVTTKDVFRQRMVTIIRAVETNGVIHTFL